MDTITLSKHEYQNIMNRLNQLEYFLSTKFKEFEAEAPEGTQEWWNKELQEAQKEIKAGNMYELRNNGEIKDFLNNIVSDNSNEKYHLKNRK